MLGVQPSRDVLGAQGGPVGLLGGVSEQVGGGLTDGETQHRYACGVGCGDDGPLKVCLTGAGGTDDTGNAPVIADEEPQHLGFLSGQVQLLDGGVDDLGGCGPRAALTGVGDDLVLGGEDGVGGQVQIPVAGVFAVQVADSLQARSPLHERGGSQDAQARSPFGDGARGEALHTLPVRGGRVPGCDVENLTDGEFEVVAAEDRALTSERVHGTGNRQSVVGANGGIDDARSVRAGDTKLGGGFP
ncbi:hypothetical protein V6U84_57750 [Micromonospora sp. CPCC 205714]